MTARAAYKLIRGKLYRDDPGQRVRILSLELEWNLANCAVIELPIVAVGAPGQA